MEPNLMGSLKCEPFKSGQSATNELREGNKEPGCRGNQSNPEKDPAGQFGSSLSADDDLLLRG